jgi:putative membrane protein
MVIERAGHAGGGWPDGLAWVIFAVLLALLLVAIVSLALDFYYRSNGGPRGGVLAALDQRYASGEIGRDEYLQKRADLGGPAAPVEKTATTRVRGPKAQPT